MMNKDRKRKPTSDEVHIYLSEILYVLLKREIIN